MLSHTMACPYETITGTLLPPPDGSWTSAGWTITGGMFRLPDYPYQASTAYGMEVELFADGSGPVTVTAVAGHSSGCTTAETSATVSLRTIETPPVITTAAEELCPNAQATATVDPPAEGTWTSYDWTIEGGYFVLPEYPYRASMAWTPEVTYALEGPGPVTLRVTTRDSSGCYTPQASKEIPLRTIPPPVINVATADVCLYETTTASAAPPEEGTWESYFWTIDGGTFQSYDYPYNSTTAYTPEVRFYPTSSGPVTLHLTTRDNLGCESTASQVLPQRPSTMEIVLNSETCPTSATVVNAGNPYGIWWQWGGVVVHGPTNEPTLQFTPSGQGEIWLKAVATYDTGCNVERVLTYTPTGLADTSITLSSGLCVGRPATASVPDAGPGATYFWDANGTGSIFGSATERTVTVYPNTDSLDLTVRVTNAAGCPASSTIHAAVGRPPMFPGFESVPTTMCAGSTATASTRAEPGSWTYIWEVVGGEILTGQNTRTITFRAGAASPVTVRVTKRYWQGCSTTYEQQITVPQPVPQPTVTASGPTAFCEGGSVTLTAPAGYTYQWSNGATTQSITVGATGNYSVTVSDPSGCGTATSEPVAVTVSTPPPTPVVTASGPTTFCEGGAVILTAPAGYTYLWSNGATTRSIAVTSSGSHTVTVTDASGCSSTSSPTEVTVKAAPATPVITASGPTSFCEGGSVTLTAPPAPGYLWSNGATTQSITVGESGSYSVAVTNENGCSTSSAPTNVTVSPLPEATITASTTTLCTYDGVTYGSATLTASPGWGYLWSNGATTQSITVNTPGTYTVTVSDQWCSKTSEPVTIVSESVAVSIAGSDTTLCPGESVSLTSTVNGTAASYQWYGFAGEAIRGATGPTLTITPAPNAGTSYYFLRIVTPGGCEFQSNTFVYNVSQPDATITPSGPTTFCEGGSVELSAPDTPDSTYLWSIGSTDRTVTVTESGTYSVTVTNGDGCSATSDPVIVSVNANPETPAVTASGPLAFCQGGSVTLTAPSAASYLWSNGETTQAITVSASGSYTVTVANESGCSATSAPTVVTVNADPATPAVTASGPTTFCEGGSVTLTAPSAASYLWSNGATTQSITVSASGSYAVTVTNASGCSATSASTNVTVNPLPDATISASGPTTFCEGGSVTLTAPSSASYLWSNGATAQSITVSASGSYGVTVTNASGCSATSAPVAVTVNPNPSTPSISASGPTTFCPGGSVTLTAPAGFSYLWSNGATTQSIVANASGSYGVTVTNANGCSAASAPTNVTVTTATAITQQPQSVTIPKNTSHTLTVTATGTGALTYQWYRGSSGNTSSPIPGATSSTYNTGKLTRGTYSYWVRVTGTCGSVNSATATVTAQ